MRKLDEMVLKVKTRLQRTTQDATEKVEEVVRTTAEKVIVKRNGDGKVIVAAVLIVIAIALCVTFRTELTEWLGELITRTTNGIQKFKSSTM